MVRAEAEDRTVVTTGREATTVTRGEGEVRTGDEGEPEAVTRIGAATVTGGMMTAVTVIGGGPLESPSSICSPHVREAVEVGGTPEVTDEAVADEVVTGGAAGVETGGRPGTCGDENGG